MQRLSGRVPGGGDGEHGETVPERTEEEDRETERVQEGQGDRESGQEGQGGLHYLVLCTDFLLIGW